MEETKVKKPRYTALKTLKINRHNKEIKKEVLRKLDNNLFIYEANVKGCMLQYTDLKLNKKLIEIVEEQDYLNIPISYTAVFYFPKEGEKINAEIVHISERLMKLEAYGFINIVVDLEPLNESLNITPNASISLLPQKRTIKIGDIISTTIIKYYIRPDKNIVLASSFDLDNYIPLFK